VEHIHHMHDSPLTALLSPSLGMLNSNVSNAMGLHAHPLLSHVRLLLLQDPSTLYKAIEALPIAASKGPVGYLLKFDNALIQAIAKGNSIS